MAASRSTQLEDHMCCGVCMQTFDRRRLPKLLPCQHTFCEVCIRQSTSRNSFPPSMNCPICRCKQVIPQGGFVTNRAVLDIVEEFMKDTPRDISIPLKCKKHSNKEVILVCIDCLDIMCNTCVKSSVHLQDKHHVEEVDDAAPALQQKFKESQCSHKKKLSMLEESHCSSNEMAKAAKDITFIANKLHDEINKWESEQLAMIQEMSSFIEAQEKKFRIKLDTLNHNIEALISKIRQTQSLSKEVEEEDFMNKLQKRKTTVQNQLNKSLQTLPDNMRAIIDSKTTIQSAFLKQVGNLTSQQSMNVVTRPTKDKDGALKSQVMESKIPKDVKVLYKVRAIRSEANAGFKNSLPLKAGEVIAVTEELEDDYEDIILMGINIATGQKGQLWAWNVKKLQY